jgi:site-specific DNA recombinase
MTGLEIVKVFRDPMVSARKIPLAKRPGGAAMLAYLQEHGIKHVIAQKLDRLFRNVEDGLGWLRRWRKSGVTMHLSDQGGVSLNASTATGKLIVTFLLGVAEFEPNQTSERTSLAMKHHQTHGKKMGSQAPFGYRFDGNLVVPDAAEHVLAEMMHEMVNVLGYSMCKTAEVLGDQGYDFRGKLIRHGTVRRGLAYFAQSASVLA